MPLAGTGFQAGGSLLVQRSTGSVSFLDEINATTGEARQTARLPTGCYIPPGYNSGLGSTTLNGAYAMFMCSAGSTNRVVARVAPSGTADYTTTLVTTQTAFMPRGAASPDGITAIYGIDARAIWYRSGYGGALSTLTTLYYYLNARMVTYSTAQNATLLVMGCTSSAVPCANSALWYSTPFMPTAVSGQTVTSRTPVAAI